MFGDGFIHLIEGVYSYPRVLDDSVKYHKRLYHLSFYSFYLKRTENYVCIIC